MPGGSRELVETFGTREHDEAPWEAVDVPLALHMLELVRIKNMIPDSGNLTCGSKNSRLTGKLMFACTGR
jgi:hypothetical protein